MALSIEGFSDPEALVAQLGINEGMSIADFGSGSGHLALSMGKRLGKDGKVSAFDIMDSAIESLRARAGTLDLANIDVRKANLEIPGSTGLPDGSQDMVVMANVLFQNKNKAEIIREGKRILKEGGKMVIIDWNKGSAGFGPPDELRTEEAQMEQIVTSEGLITETKKTISKFQHLMIFRK